MRVPPPNLELGLQLTTANFAAWHVLGLLLGHGRPTAPADLSSSFNSFESFNLTPEFIHFLCSVPNSPIRITANQSVTISHIGVAAIAQFVANSTPFVPRLLSNIRSYDIVWTYCRKRKKLELKGERFIPMKKRCCEEEQNRMLMTDGLQNVQTQGVNTLSSLSSPSEYKYWEPESIMLGSRMVSKFHSGQQAYEIDHVECTLNTMDGPGYSHKKGCESDFLLQGSFPYIQKTVVAKDMVNSFPLSRNLLLEHTVNSEGCSVGNINVVNSNSTSTSSGLKVAQMNISHTVNKNVVCTCSLLNEGSSGKRNKVLLHELDRCRGCKENHPTEIIDNEGADTDPEKMVAEPRNTGIQAITPGEGHLHSQGGMLNHLNSASTSEPEKNETNDRKKAISPTTDNCKYRPGKGIEQVRRDKDVTSNKQNTKRNSDHNLNSKEGEMSIENSRGRQNEQKPFPNFKQFVVEEEEGSGGYGTVYRAKRIADGVQFAIKCPHANANVNYVHNELKMLERLGGKNFVIKYEGSLKDGSNDCLVLEHVEHDRPEILKREITVIQLQWYGYCLFKALAGLHKKGIVHRDVKPGNFLFSRKVNKGYLIDFNLALDISKKHGTIGHNSKARHSQIGHIPVFQTQTLPPEKNRKLMNRKLPDEVNKDAGKLSKSVFSPVDLKKGVGNGKPAITKTSSKNSIRSQGAEVSGITSAERLREPLPIQGRKELLSLVQEAMQGGNHKSPNAPTSKRKRVAAPPGDATHASSKCFHPTPMPLYSNGLAVGCTGFLKGKADGKRKRDGPCAGTKGFKAPEVLFRSLHQGLKTDVWSAGVTLLYLMIGRTPFVGDTDQNLKEIAKLRGSENLWEVAKIHDHESLFPSVLQDVKYLFPVKLQDWCAQSTRRPDFLEAIPRSLYDLVDKCLTVNPRQRISAEEALRHEFFAPCHEALRKQRQQQDKVHS